MAQKIPLMSVTLTSYNYANYIGQTIESILKQTFTDFEVVIFDDASTDNSVEIIQKYAEQDDRICLYANEVNKGYGQTLYDVSNAARGKYIVHMDSDDWVRSPTAFERQVTILEENPDVVFVYSTLAEYNNAGQRKMTMRSFHNDVIVPGAVAVEKAMEFYIGHSGPMFRREAFQQFGGYKLEYDYVVDLQLWFDLCKLGRVGYIHENLYAYRKHNRSMTAVLKQKRLMQEMLQAIDTVFEGPLAKEMDDPAAVRRKAYAHALTAVPMTLVFDSNYHQCWKIMWESIKLRPYEALLNRRLAIITARTLLGSRGYGKLRQSLFPYQNSKRQLIISD